MFKSYHYGLEGSFKDTSYYKALAEELEFIKKYKESWATAPYAPIFVTTDSVVVCSGHVLLVTRRANPGKGLLALPGGFLNQYEKVVDGMIRELREETKIKVPEAVLRGNIKKIQAFDDPYRSARGRTITHCGLIELPNGELPRVKGSDDALKAGWFELSKLEPSMFFEDHYEILQAMLAI
jgi:bifunctional NMN adenylyltransferase/nudix hydrolase